MKSLLFIALTFSLYAHAYDPQCPNTTVSKEEVLKVSTESLFKEAHGKGAIVDCDAQELFLQLEGLKHIEEWGVISSMGDRQEFKRLTKNKLILECREMTLITDPKRPSIFDCVVFDENNGGKRIKDIGALTKALAVFGIKLETSEQVEK